jgi:hypothetical protein
MSVPAHIQKVTHTYFVAYPEHDPRKGDVHYRDFNHYRAQTRATAQCAIGLHRNDFSECFPPPQHWPTGLELHHSHIEFALQNGIDLAWLEVDYPGVSDPNTVGAWVESAANLQWLCVWHHRGLGGVHRLTVSDGEAIKYVRGLISNG